MAFVALGTTPVLSEAIEHPLRGRVVVRVEDNTGVEKRCIQLSRDKVPLSMYGESNLRISPFKTTDGLAESG
jgi:hypothetical protein